jgi:hypothetical protein
MSGTGVSDLRLCHLRDTESFNRFREEFERTHSDLRFGLFESMGVETILRSDHRGMKVFWLYEGEGEVFLPKGFRTKEGDGQRLPAEYEPDRMDPQFAVNLALLEEDVGNLSPAAQTPLNAILSRRREGCFIGDYANDLWKIEHVSDLGTDHPKVLEAIHFLFRVYRSQGYSTKRVDSFEKIIEGDQLIVAGSEELKVRGSFSCLTLEKAGLSSSHIPAVMRLRYLKDSSGGCNFDFDPFRRLPLTWYLNLPGEEGDGLNFANSHVVNIAREFSPTHFHPPKAVGGGMPQYEMYLVLDPQTYGVKTYGRKASIILYPDLHDLSRFEEHSLEPGSFVYIPPGTGHRGLDVFVNVLTVPGFKPHNEYYLDREIYETTHGDTPYNPDLMDIKNDTCLAELL